jgi:hypothetical protein
VIKVEGGELQDRNGKQKMHRIRKMSMGKLLVIAVALVIVLVIMTLPSIQVTRIIVFTDLDTIKNVSVETPRIPLVVWLIPSPSVATGAYTINLSVYKSGTLTFNSTLENVPSGEYTFTWVSNGQPEAGTYHVTVQLLKGNMQVDFYSLDTEFR